MTAVSTLATLNMTLGECPRWNEVEQTWYWVDILGNLFYRYNPQTDVLEKREFSFAPACFAFTQHNHIVLTSANGIYWLADFHAPEKRLANPEQHISDNRFNDGITAPDGTFIARTIGDGVQPTGSTYRINLTETRAEVDVLQTNFKIINGQAFSPDGKYYYVTDTPTQQIYRYSYQRNGTLSNATLFYQCEEDEFPDGAAVDSQGNYWVAMYGSSKVSVISAQGKKLRDIALPVSQPTMVAFGGKDLNQLIITSAAQTLTPNQLAQEPLAGSVFILNSPVIGTLPTRMKDADSTGSNDETET